MASGVSFILHCIMEKALVEQMDWSGAMADKIGTGECGEILVYQTDNGQTNIEVKIEDDTVWLTQQQMSEFPTGSKRRKS